MKNAWWNVWSETSTAILSTNLVGVPGDVENICQLLGTLAPPRSYLLEPGDIANIMMDDPQLEGQRLRVHPLQPPDQQCATTEQLARARCRGGCLARPYANHDHELRPRAGARVAAS